MIDIVTRLRESDGGYFMRKMFTEAADEIERLRAERDEARREVCMSEAKHLPTMADPHREANRRGWDCFETDKAADATCKGILYNSNTAQDQDEDGA